jgi:hypothetical protein
MLSHFTETSRLEKPYPRRPFPVAPDLLGSPKVLYFLVLVFLGLPLNLLLTVKWVRRLEALSKPSLAAIFLYYLFDCVPMFFGFPIIANCLNMAFGSRHQMGQIFIWGVLQFFVLYFPTALFMAVWHFSLRGYAYAAWLSTFDEDWMEKDRYALWWKLIRFDIWLSNLGIEESVESQLDFFENYLVSTWKQERVELGLVEQEKKKKMLENIKFDDGVVSKLLK